jgi:membrane protein implicated in regulation of membrane protease activity
MSGFVWWFVLGFILLVAELATGTFYLLVIATALGAAGIASLLGASFPTQLVIAAAIGFGGSLWLRQTRVGRLRSADAGTALQNLDVGQTVRINEWTAGRTARASYRGAQWDIELAAGEEPVPGEFVIREIHANRLVVGARSAG